MLCSQYFFFFKISSTWWFETWSHSSRPIVSIIGAHILRHAWCCQCDTCPISTRACPNGIIPSPLLSPPLHPPNPSLPAIRGMTQPLFLSFWILDFSAFTSLRDVFDRVVLCCVVWWTHGNKVETSLWLFVYILLLILWCITLIHLEIKITFFLMM